MSKDWYLMKSPTLLSGYEDEMFDGSAFLEVLDTEVASDIEIVNYDLSEHTPMKAVVLNNVQDTKLKSLQRNVLLPIGSCKAGMYIKYKNRYWLIIGLVDDNKIYEKAIAIICNYYLTWINDEGEIVQRWVNISSASQYNNGETDSRNFLVRTDQLMILTPDDNECLMLSSGKRFIIDRRCRVYEEHFDDDVVKDTSKSVIVYRLTRADSVLYDYQDGGHYEFLAYQDEQRDTDGYYVIDGQGYWLCGEPKAEADETVILLPSIQCESPEIFCGLEPTEFKAEFYDADGDIVYDVQPKWEINCNFVSDLDVVYVEDSVLISTENDELLNKTFDLILSADGYEPTTITVQIKAFL